MQRAIGVPLALLSTALLAQGPVHHWPLDEGTGALAFDIAGGSNGILQNGVAQQPGGGWFGGAYQFDGADDRVDLGPCDITTGTGGFSISLWMKAGLMTGTEQMLLAKTVGPAPDDYVWSLSQVNSTAVRFRLQTTGTVTELTTTGSSLFSGSWYHIAATYDGSMMRIHLNGALITFAPKNGGIPYAPMSPASMGDRLDGFASFLGQLDDVRLYDHGLSETEIFDILLEDVTTGLDVHATLGWSAEGGVTLPPGSWERMRIIDARGRIVMERDMGEGNVAALRDEAPGLYLVCLQGPHGEMVRPLVKP